MPDTESPPVITRNDVVRLLALTAGGDQRTVAAEDVALWLEVARMHRWTFPAAQRVIIEHYASGADRPRISPAAITDRLRTLRGKAAESFEAPRLPDDGLAAADYPAWLRGRLAEHVDRVLARWAETGQPVPEAKPIGPARVSGLAALVATAPPEHREQLVSGARSTGRPEVGARPRATRDATRRAAAQAELDAVRPRAAAEPQQAAGEGA